MKVKIAKSMLHVATSRVQGALTDRSLGQIGLKTAKNHLRLAATDRVLAIYNQLECEIEQDGELFVPARLFSDVVRELPDGDVILVRKGAYLEILAGKNDSFQMKLPIIEELSWREPPKDAQTFRENSAELPCGRLAYAIDQVQFCVASDSPRNYGTVAFFHKPGSGSCRLVGTDGFRLSYSEIDTTTSDSFLRNGICLSKRALAELARMCNEGFEQLKISISDDETTMVAEVPGYEIFIRLSAIKYPNYLGVLPKNKMAGVLVPRQHLQSVTKRVLLAADKSRALQLSFSSTSLTLNSKTMGSSEGRETIQLDDYSGPKFEVAVNGKFLTDVFSTAGGENLTLSFNDKNNEDPIVIVPRGEPKECRSRHVLVPIKQNA